MTGPIARPPRIFYFAPVATGADAGQGIPAVQNKVLGVCSAIQAAGGRVVLVSPIAPRDAVSIFRPLRVARLGRLPVGQVFSRGRGGLQRIVQLFTLPLAAWRLVGKSDRVIFYNYYPEYLVAALLLRLRGAYCLIDIEDAPRNDQCDARGVMNRWSYSLLRGITSSRALIVSETLAQQLGINDNLAVYGVASYFDVAVERQPLFSLPAVRINLGGTIWRETGGVLFAEAMKLLVRRSGSVPLHVFVTGHIDKGLFHGLADAVNASPALRLEIVPDLDASSYAALLATMDVGLCLKLPSHSVGQTTFPSKVVEIAAKGLLLVTTPVSDVPLIFDESCAIILKSEEPAELAEVLAALPDRRDEMAVRAEAGKRRVSERLSALAVGLAVRTFLEA